MSLFILIAGYLAAGIIFEGAGLILSKACVLASMIALIGYRLKTTGLGWKAAGWGPIDPLREFSWAGVCALAVWTLAFFFLRADSNHAAVSKWSAVLDQPNGKLVFFVSCCLITGVLEELVYRGALRAFIRRDSAFVAASALLFAAFHGLSTPWDFVVYAAMGAVFAGTLIASRSLRAVMLAHILVNTAHLFGLGSRVRHLFGS